jgi:DNA-binding CsgD family transcriptional regulator
MNAVNVFAALATPLVDRPCVSRSEQARKSPPVQWPPGSNGSLKRLDVPLVANPWKLTPIQCAVMNLRSQGDTYVAISCKLAIKAKTVWSHMDVARKKMDVTTLRQAEQMWGRWAREQAAA